MQPLFQLAAAASGSLIAAVWEGLLLAALVAICLRLLPGLSAAARSIVWSAAMVAIIALPFLHKASAVANGTDTAIHLDQRLSFALAAVWLSVSLFRAAELVRSAVYLRQIARSARPIAAEPEIVALLAGQRAVELCVSDVVDRPSVAGFFAPRILLPASLLARLSSAELAQIVLHEMEHLRRRDDWTNLLQKLALVVFPLNPVLVWIERRLCLERELACDDEVLRATNARKAYAACLANLAEHALIRRGVSLALGAWERQSELVRRVHRILLRPSREMSRPQLAGSVVCLLAAVLGSADLLAHAPQLVSFAPAAAAPTIAAESPAPYVSQPTFAPAHPTLVKANVAARRPGMLIKTDVHAKHRVIRPESAERIAYDQPRQELAVDSPTVVVLVTWQSSDATPERMIVRRTQFSYAAVPTPNGWLFLQL